MKKIVTGILAHVDSGKTTLSESILYSSGSIRKLGRVDHKDTFLDTNRIEKERGITIFSHQAVIKLPDTQLTILDTPGHVDFSAETERVLSVLDYAILVVSGTDLVQSHTKTLWTLLKKHNIPTFIFVNKMDLSTYTKPAIIANLKAKLDEGCVDFLSRDEAFFDTIAMCSESLMEEYLETGSFCDSSLTAAINKRKLFPCFFGSALKLTGVNEFLDAFIKFTKPPKSVSDFGAMVFKISQDEQNNRQTHLKITGGTLSVRDLIDEYGEKVNRIRIYSGDKFENVKEASAGDVCTVTGLTKSKAGDGIGFSKSATPLTLEPIFSYKLNILSDINPHTAMDYLKTLEEEETKLNVIWNEELEEITLQLMGEVQLEVIKRIIKERFLMDVEFLQGSIVYKETIKNTVEGIGHYEPLRHYAEVHLLLEPLPRGSGLVFKTDCSEEILSRNFQRLVLTHLEEKSHKGVLVGAPITDMKITLISGRAHLKHTEGGDFRQATYRAVRQGLMRAESVLLEPWYDFSVELPTQNVGRFMMDIEQMGGRLNPLEQLDDTTTLISGGVAISKMHGYSSVLNSYSHGLAKLFCAFGGYDECKDSDAIILEKGYNPEADKYNSPDSVFCANGAGFNVKWDEVENYMHLDSLNHKVTKNVVTRRSSMSDVIDEDELVRIFELAYGKIERKSVKPLKTVKEPVKYKKPRPKPKGDEYLLIDGYNIIFAWDDLKEMASKNLDSAREALINRIISYQVMRGINVIIVFDAYKVKGNLGEVEKRSNITVVYTKEAETADSYIERVTHTLSKDHRVRVATSDNIEQLIILGNGALRVSANEFLAEVKATESEIRKLIENEF